MGAGEVIAPGDLNQTYASGLYAGRTPQGDPWTGDVPLRAPPSATARSREAMGSSGRYAVDLDLWCHGISCPLVDKSGRSPATRGATRVDGLDSVNATQKALVAVTVRVTCTANIQAQTVDAFTNTPSRSS